MCLKIKTLVFFFSLSLISYSQANLNSSVRKFLYQIAQSDKSLNCSLLNTLVQEYDLMKINNTYYISILAIVDEKSISKTELAQFGVLINSQLQNMWSMKVPVTVLKDIANLKGITHIEAGSYHAPFLEHAVPSARVDSVHYGLGGLSREYKGSGVIVAVIDWGFDYTHPNFYDTTLTNLRISRAWDQNKLSGTAPDGYSYGAEYVGQDALLEAGTDTMYLFGPISHGTHVAGIAGGTGAGTKHIGVAYDSELVFVSLRRNAASLIDAFTYITNYASLVNKPYVVNMSFGSHLGAHDGVSLENMAIDILHGPGKVFVGSAGNNGTSSANFHLDKDFSQSVADTLMTVIGFGSNIQNMFGQTLSMWGSPFTDFAVALRLVDSNDSTIYETPFYHSNLEPFINDTILTDNDSLIVMIESNARYFLNDRPNIRIDVKKTGVKKLVVLAISEDTHLHIWNTIRLQNRNTNWGSPLSSSYPGAIAGDNFYGLGEPAGVGKNVITVGSYRAEVLLPNNNLLYGNISSFSSFGPTVDNRAKPDISSTGQNVLSSVSSFDLSEVQYHTSVDFNGKTYGFVAYSGTSMSGPMVTGIVALMLEAYPKMTASQVKEILKATARLDQYTGAIGPDGHLQWGWGKANALAAVKTAEVLSNVQNIEIHQDLFRLFPNPANDFVNIFTDESSKIKIVEIFDMQGRLVASYNNTVENSINIHISNFENGLYLVRVQTDKYIGISRLVVFR